MADPQIGLDIDRVVLFERDVNRAQGAGDNGRAAFGKGEAGPFAPLGEGAGDHHAARRRLLTIRAPRRRWVRTQESYGSPSSRRRATYSPKGVSGSRCLTVGRSGA